MAICYVLLVWLIGRLEKQIAEIEKKVDIMLLKGNDNNRSLNGISLPNGKLSLVLFDCKPNVPYHRNTV
jgi:hypothetical protein